MNHTTDKMAAPGKGRPKHNQRLKHDTRGPGGASAPLTMQAANAIDAAVDGIVAELDRMGIRIHDTQFTASLYRLAHGFFTGIVTAQDLEEGR